MKDSKVIAGRLAAALDASQLVLTDVVVGGVGADVHGRREREKGEETEHVCECFQVNEVDSEETTVVELSTMRIARDCNAGNSVNNEPAKPDLM